MAQIYEPDPDPHAGPNPEPYSPPDRSILPQLPVAKGEPTIGLEELSGDYEALCLSMKRRIANIGHRPRRGGGVNAKVPHVIVIDGVDELEGTDYEWLPRHLPEGFPRHRFSSVFLRIDITLVFNPGSNPNPIKKVFE